MRVGIIGYDDAIEWVFFKYFNNLMILPELIKNPEYNFL